MPHNADRILTTHVGSLIRPPKLIEFWRAIEDGKPYDEAAFEACLTESVAEVVRQQAEVGIDISAEFPKPLTDGKVRAADIVITMGCGDTCPVYPGKRYLDWDLPDPAGLPLDQVRPIRDQISARVRELISELSA